MGSIKLERNNTKEEKSYRRVGRRASKVSWESTFTDVKIAKEL